MAVKMRVIGGKWSRKMAPENGGIGTTLATSKPRKDDEMLTASLCAVRIPPPQEMPHF